MSRRRFSSRRQSYLQVPGLEQTFSVVWAQHVSWGPPHTHTCWDMTDAAPDGRDPRTALPPHTDVQSSHSKFLPVDDSDHAAPAAPGLPCETGVNNSDAHVRSEPLCKGVVTAPTSSNGKVRLRKTRCPKTHS